MAQLSSLGPTLVEHHQLWRCLPASVSYRCESTWFVSHMCENPSPPQTLLLVAVIPYFRYNIVTAGGSKIGGAPEIYMLERVIECAERDLGQCGALSYDKIWRGIRHDGAYAEVVSLANVPGHDERSVGVVIFSRAVGKEVPLVPRPTRKPQPAAVSQGREKSSSEIQG